MTGVVEIEKLLTDHLDVWTSAIERRSTAGRGRSRKFSLYGIEKLRALILDLAVRGKLVPQDPTEKQHPALVTLVGPRNATFGDRLLNGPQDVPAHASPEAWLALTFGRIFSLEYGGNLPDKSRTQTGEYPVFGSNGIVGTHNKANVQSPCLVVGRKGSAGAVNLSLDSGCWVTDVAYSCIPPEGIAIRFALMLFKTLGLDALGKGIKPGLNRNEAYALPVAIPPFAEQNRIVTKVDELMALCDALEAGTYDTIEAHSLLVKELLATLTSSASAQDFAQNWARIETHFDTLFTTEDSIDQLKQTILQLAVMGKLVPQDPDDEPAENLFKGTGTRLTTKLAAHGKSSFAGELPIGWVLHPLGSIGDIVGGGTPSKSNPEFWNGDIPWVSPKDMKQDYISDAADKISRAALESSATKLVKTDSLLIVVRGMILAHSFPVAITTAEVTINQDMKAIELGKLSPAYVLVMMKGMKPDFLRLVERSSHGTCKLVSARLWATLLPIPPLAEQARIVFKVRELTAILDTLKLQLSNAEHQQIELAHAISSRILG